MRETQREVFVSTFKAKVGLEAIHGETLAKLSARANCFVARYSEARLSR